MKWEAKKKSKWRRRFALWPMKFTDRWVWLETYYAWDCGIYTAICLPEELSAEELSPEA